MTLFYFQDHIKWQQASYDAIPLERMKRKKYHDEDQQLPAFDNGDSASNVSNFIIDLGKSASDKLASQDGGRRFQGISLNKNLSWITAIGNDYAYEDVYLR